MRKVRVRRALLVAVALVVILCGCGHPHSDVISYGGWFSYPPGTKYPDGEYSAAVTVQRRMVDNPDHVGPVKVVVTIVRGRFKFTQLERTYNVTSRNLECDVKWDSLDSLQIHLYEPDTLQSRDTVTGRHPI